MAKCSNCGSSVSFWNSTCPGCGCSRTYTERVRKANAPTKYVKCSRCNGKGSYESTRTVPAGGAPGIHCGATRTERYHATCSACNGTGQVLQQNDSDYETKTHYRW